MNIQGLEEWLTSYCIFQKQITMSGRVVNEYECSVNDKVLVVYIGDEFYCYRVLPVENGQTIDDQSECTQFTSLEELASMYQELVGLKR
jgi:hypothetical protein